MGGVRTEEVADVVVVGSGAAGLSAALAAAEAGLSVVVLEKADLIGGTTAWSGGMPWVPLNKHQRELGIDDSRAEVMQYLDGLLEGREPSRELVDAFVDRAAEALEFVESRTPLRMSTLSAYPDYYGDRPGAKAAGRSVEPEPRDYRELLGEWFERVRESPLMPRVTREEMTSGADIAELSTRRGENGVRTMGGALVSALLVGVLERGVQVRTGTAAHGLLTEEDRVIGVVAEHRDQELRLHARSGVVLACGGFEGDPDLVRAYLGVADALPLSPAGNVGDGLRMGLALGAAVGNMTSAVTRPCVWDGVTMLDGQPLALMSNLRHDPACIIVNRHGRRFVNEGISYMDMGKMLKAFDARRAEYPDAGAVWMVFDQSARERTRLGDLVPDAPTPQWVTQAETIEELARAIGVEGDVLVSEVARYNRFAASGEDSNFGRGTVWFEGLSAGGPTPQRNMSPIDRAPFYATRLRYGIFGTIGGLLTNRHGQVLRTKGEVIEGLYAVGNVAAGALGQTYPGGGSSLGPNITFGYLAGRNLASDALAPNAMAADREVGRT